METSHQKTADSSRETGQEGPPQGRRYPQNQSVAIVGPGRLGQALGKLLARAGIPIRYIAARRLAAACRAVRFIGSGRPIILDAPELREASVILLTTADSALQQVARNLADWSTRRGGRLGSRNLWSGKVVLHTCGSLPASVLEPLGRRGAAIGSLHPFQTIPSPAAGLRSLVGCFWGIEGDREARRVAAQWVRALGGVAVRIRPAQKTLYHAAAFLVCPTLVTLMEKSVQLLRRCGIPAGTARRMLGQFVAQTVQNFVELGGRRALTGPAARGDWATIQAHLNALGHSSPDFIPVYKALLRAMLRLARRHRPGRLRKLLEA